jgi:RimJ/RimL family protein N-acetyltransferase
MQVPSIVELGTGLVLRPMDEADEALFCDLYSDAETMRFIGPPLLRERAARGFHTILRLMRRPAADQVFFTLRETISIDGADCEAKVGIASIQHIDLTTRSAEAGIIIGSKHRDRGFARATLAGLIRFGFERLQLDEVWVRINADHTVAGKLVRSVGLREGSTDAHDCDSSLRLWSARRASWKPPRIVGSS